MKRVGATKEELPTGSSVVEDAEEEVGETEVEVEVEEVEVEVEGVAVGGFMTTPGMY